MLTIGLSDKVVLMVVDGGIVEPIVCGGVLSLGVERCMALLVRASRRDSVLF